MGLTQKQETFTQNLFRGMSQREAYIQAGYSSRSSVAVIDNHAYELAHNGEVLIRLTELNRKAEDDTIAAPRERKQVLTKVVRNPLIPYKIKARDTISAITELNKMEKIYDQPIERPDIVQTFIFVLPDGTRVQPKQLKQIEGEVVDEKTVELD